jgi:hypothetical protein
MAATLESLGWVRHWKQWRPRGRINMRKIANRTGSVQEAIAGERARRLVAIDRHRHAGFHTTVADVHIKELIACLTSDRVAAEGIRRDLLAIAAEMAGPGPSAGVRCLAITAALLKCEYDLASSEHLAALRSPRGVAPHLEAAMIRWRDFTKKRLDGTILAIAKARAIEESDIRRSLGRLNVAG